MATIRRAEHAVTTPLDDVLLVLNIPQSLYHSLNSAGARIWELLEHSTTEAALVERLVTEFDVSHEQCGRDVGYFLNSLRERNLIVDEF